MKALIKYLTMSLAVAALCLGYTSCGDDDDDDNGSNGSNSLKGTTWVVDTSSERSFRGLYFTFNSNGKVTSDWCDEEDDFITYKYDGTTLTLNFNNDDCITGTFVINGNSATYTYYWYDYDGEWSDEDSKEEMILTRQ